MNRTFKTLGGLALGAVAVTGLSLVAARVMRNRGTQALTSAPSVAYESHTGQLPSSSEFALIRLVQDYGWPTHSNDKFKFGTDLTGPYLLVRVGQREARLEFADASGTGFVIARYDGTEVTGKLAKPDPTYAEAVQEFGHL